MLPPAWLDDAASLSHGYTARLLRGEGPSRPPPEVVHKIARAFGYTDEGFAGDTMEVSPYVTVRLPVHDLVDATMAELMRRFGPALHALRGGREQMQGPKDAGEDAGAAEMMALIHQMSVLAPMVASVHAKGSAAEEERRDAAARLLDGVIALIRPALLAMCSRIPAKKRPSDAEYLSVRGVRLWTGNSEDGPAYYLLDDGSLLRCVLKQGWTANAWTIETSTACSTREAVRELDPVHVIRTLSSELEAHATGAKPQVIDRLKVITRRLDALANLATELGR
ncbi:MAG: hypothetical protein ACTHU0_21565 [Kofleriaceae bacterium]